MQSETLAVRLDPVRVTDSYFADGSAQATLSNLGRALAFPYEAVGKGQEYVKAAFRSGRRDVDLALHLAEQRAFELTARLAAEPDIPAPDVFAGRPRLRALVEFLRKGAPK